MKTVAKVLLGALITWMWTVPVSAGPTYRSYDPSTGNYITYDLVQAVSTSTAAGKAVRRSYTPIRRQLVKYDGPHAPGTLIVNTGERRLYHVQEDGRAWKYGVGVGREGFEWSGTNRISRKAEWPGWTPPKQMIAREARRGVTLPAYMEGGIDNPLGARALYLGNTLYRIHGTAAPWTIGQAVSSGCIRMINEDVIHLYENVKIGAKVVVL